MKLVHTSLVTKGESPREDHLRDGEIVGHSRHTKSGLNRCTYRLTEEEEEEV